MKAGSIVSALLMALAAVGVNARAVGPDGKILVAYLPYWDNVRASYLDFTKVTHVNYAFANIDSTGSVTVPATDNSIITNFAADCHAGDAKAIVSIGGWGIQPFSTAFASAAGINTFVSTVSALMTKYNLDGIDIDWEYPGEQGACQNPWSTADTANFLTALKALRAAIPGKLITAAPPAYPWKDATGQPSKDLSAYAQIFDFVNLMAYDLNGIWGTHTGASAPLIQDVGNLGTPGGNVRDAVQSWLAAGFPASKLALGTPFYGHYMSPVSPMTNNKDSDINVPVIKGSTGHDCAGAGLGGTFTFVQVYPYTQDTTGEWIKHFDTWTQTPWLYNPKTNIFISYDDSRSIAIKSAYAACMGLKGVMTWEATIDGGALMPALSTFFTAAAGTPGVDCVAQVASITSVPQPSPTNVGPSPNDLTSRCGASWADANTHCYDMCFSNAQCGVGQNCYNALNACSSNQHPGPGECFLPWVASYTYSADVEVSYNGQNWKAAYYLNPGTIPGSGTNGWVSTGACSAGSSSKTTTTTTTTTTAKPTTTTTAKPTTSTTTTTTTVPTTSTTTTTKATTTQSTTTTTTTAAPTTTTTTTTTAPTTTSTTTTLKPTTSTTTTTTTTAATSTTTVASNCYPAWSASSTYNGGAQVSYQNVNYVANWWAGSTDVPPSAAWKVVGPCGGSGSTTTTTTTTTSKPTTTTVTTTNPATSTTTTIAKSTTTTTTTTVKPTTTTTTTTNAATTTAASGGPVVGQPCTAGKNECSAGTMYYCLASSWIVWYVGC